MNQEVITLEKVKETIPAIEIAMKQCRKKDCLQLKPLREFHMNKISADGYSIYCRTCVKKYSQGWLIKKNEQTLDKLKADCIKQPNESTEGLRQCQRSSCQKLKPLNEFGVSLSYPDGYLPFCKDCILKGTLKDAINQELAQRAKDNYIKPVDVIFYPIPFDNFIELKIIDRPHPPVSEYLFESKTADHYILPDDISCVMDEYCHGEPPSSYKDFIRLTEPDTSFYEQAKSILESWNELAEVA